LLREGYDGYASAALEERAAAGWPPFSRLALLRAEAATREAALGFLDAARARALGPAGEAVRLLGPVAAAMERRAGRYRAQLLLESTSRAALHRLLGAWLPGLDEMPEVRGVRWSIDVDPLEAS
jgi:primosomal protein N' (replication factor Y)